MNKEIAKMLGWTYVTWQDVKNEKYPHYITRGWWEKINGFSFSNHFYICNDNNDLSFNTDWNMLMKVVNFIEEMTEVASIQIESNFCTLWVSTESSKFQDISAEANSKIEAVYLVVSDFAQQYNKHYIPE
jgi:hypothetical protein